MKLSQKVDDQDRLVMDCPVHDPNIKWKLMRPQLGEKFEAPSKRILKQLRAHNHKQLKKPPQVKRGCHPRGF